MDADNYNDYNGQLFQTGWITDQLLYKWLSLYNPLKENMCKLFWGI